MKRKEFKEKLFDALKSDVDNMTEPLKYIQWKRKMKRGRQRMQETM